MYKVISSYKGGIFKEDILNGATLSIKGAVFKIERLYIGTKPTSIFEFKSLSEFVDNDSSKELIEIDWNTSRAGLSEIGRQLGLEFVAGSSLFSNGNSKPHYKEV